VNLRPVLYNGLENARRHTLTIRSASTAALALLAMSNPAEAGSRSLGGQQTFVSCYVTCVKSLDGQATNYRICVNDLTGQTVNITQVAGHRFCHSFP